LGDGAAADEIATSDQDVDAIFPVQLMACHAGLAAGVQLTKWNDTRLIGVSPDDSAESISA
jgi:hypothetical protein